MAPKQDESTPKSAESTSNREPRVPKRILRCSECRARMFLTRYTLSIGSGRNRRRIRAFIRRCTRCEWRVYDTECGMLNGLEFKRDSRLEKRQRARGDVVDAISRHDGAMEASNNRLRKLLKKAKTGEERRRILDEMVPKPVYNKGTR